jgi:hypothetical protein
MTCARQLGGGWTVVKENGLEQMRVLEVKLKHGLVIHCAQRSRSGGGNFGTRTAWRRHNGTQPMMNLMRRMALVVSILAPTICHSAPILLLMFL